MRRAGGGGLHFFDAIAPSVTLESLDLDALYRAARYDKGGADYWNVAARRGAVPAHSTPPWSRPNGHRCPTSTAPSCSTAASRSRRSPTRVPRPWPTGRCVRWACAIPAPGKRPYAVVQLRQENVEGTLFGLVGFQTRLQAGRAEARLQDAAGTRAGGVRAVRAAPPQLLPGCAPPARPALRPARRSAPALRRPDHRRRGLRGIDRLGTGHRLAPGRRAARGDAAGRCRASRCSGRCWTASSSDATSPRFAPMNANFGLLPPLSTTLRGRGARHERKLALAARAREAMQGYLGTPAVTRSAATGARGRQGACRLLESPRRWTWTAGNPFRRHLAVERGHAARAPSSPTGATWTPSRPTRHRSDTCPRRRTTRTGAGSCSRRRRCAITWPCCGDEAAAARRSDRHLSAVRAFARFLHLDGVLPALPEALHRGASAGRERRLPRELSEELVEGLLALPDTATPRGRRDRAILETIYGLGLRLSEVVGLDLGDVDLPGELVRVLGKGAKERRQPLLGAAAEALQAHLAGVLAPTEMLATAGRQPARPGPQAPRVRGPPRAAHQPAHGPGARRERLPGTWRVCAVSPRTRSATPSPRICWTAAPGSGSSRSCSATNIWPRRRSTPIFRRRACARRSGRRTRDPGDAAAAKRKEAE